MAANRLGLEKLKLLLVVAREVDQHGSGQLVVPMREVHHDAEVDEADELEEEHKGRVGYIVDQEDCVDDDKGVPQDEQCIEVK